MSSALATLQLFLVREPADDHLGREVDAERVLADLHVDDRSLKIKSLEAAKIMKTKWLVLGCIEADFCR